MFWGSPATSADDVDQPFLQVFPYLVAHLPGALVIVPEGIGQPGIRVGRHGEARAVRKDLQVGGELAGPEGAIETHRQKGGMGNRDQEGLRRLP